MDSYISAQPSWFSLRNQLVSLGAGGGIVRSRPGIRGQNLQPNVKITNNYSVESFLINWNYTHIQ